MNPEAINQAMAELDGWEVKSQGAHMTYPWCMYRSGKIYGAGWRDEGAAWRNIPDKYTEDLNAVARVVGKLDMSQKHEYWGRLAAIGPFECIDATALQRCEAILRACGEWVEG